MSIMGAASLATTVFAYFSPTKSPYYAVIAFGTGSLVMVRGTNDANWAITFWPVFLVLAASTLLSFLSRPAFTSTEYNDQLKFARSFGISSAIMCLVWVSNGVDPLAKTSPPEFAWYYWVLYAMAILQMAIFLAYIFIFHNFDARQQGKNFVQLSLIISTLLIGNSYAVTTFRETTGRMHDSEGILALAALWGVCALYLGIYLARNIKLAPPADALEVSNVIASETSEAPQS